MAKDKENTSEKKDKKEKKSKKEPNKIVKWFKDLRIEFKKVVWPSKQTVLTNTSVVLSVIVIGSAFIGLLDTGLLELVKFLIGLSQK